MDESVGAGKYWQLAEKKTIVAYWEYSMAVVKIINMEIWWDFEDESVLYTLVWLQILLILQQMY